MTKSDRQFQKIMAGQDQLAADMREVFNLDPVGFCGFMEQVKDCYNKAPTPAVRMVYLAAIFGMSETVIRAASEVMEAETPES